MQDFLSQHNALSYFIAMMLECKLTDKNFVYTILQSLITLLRHEISEAHLNTK